jgi:hypothetical protein
MPPWFFSKILRFRFENGLTNIVPYVHHAYYAKQRFIYEAEVKQQLKRPQSPLQAAEAGQH